MELETNQTERSPFRTSRNKQQINFAFAAMINSIPDSAHSSIKLVRPTLTSLNDG